MKINVNRLVNANIYLDGNNLLGRAQEITLPVIKAKMAGHDALGMVGDMEFPAGIEKMEGKIKWASLYPEALGPAANPYKAYQLQVRGNLETYGSQGRMSEVSAVAMLTVQFKSLPLGQYKPRDNAEFETDFAASYVKLTVDGEELVEFDVLANIYKAKGEDLLATFRGNLGA
jgi:uncharacterized protein